MPQRLRWASIDKDKFEQYVTQVDLISDKRLPKHGKADYPIFNRFGLLCKNYGDFLTL